MLSRRVSNLKSFGQVVKRCVGQTSAWSIDHVDPLHTTQQQTPPQVSNALPSAWSCSVDANPFQTQSRNNKVEIPLHSAWSCAVTAPTTACQEPETPQQHQQAQQPRASTFYSNVFFPSTRVAFAPRSRFLSSQIAPDPSTSSNLIDIQDEFSRQASWFENNWTGRSKKSTDEIMGWVAACIQSVSPIPPTATALDVATGTGIFARVMSKMCTSTTGLDVTAAMLQQAEKLIDPKSHNALNYIQGDALNLPFDDNSFDVVTSRLAIHHFPKPELVVSEMARVCKPGGRVILVDLICDDDADIAAEHNRLETLRDPTHTFAVTASDLANLLSQQNLTVDYGGNPPDNDDSYLYNQMDLAAWLESTATPPHACIKIEQAFSNELAGGSKTGMEPYVDDDDRVLFSHKYMTVQAFKPM